jgi:hypothetical protein
LNGEPHIFIFVKDNYQFPRNIFSSSRTQERVEGYPQKQESSKDDLRRHPQQEVTSGRVTRIRHSLARYDMKFKVARVECNAT